MTSDRTSPGKRATIRDVAAAAGVSVATVSRVLAGNYPTSESAKSKVLAAIDKLDYVVNSHARGLAGQGSGSIAILVEQVTSPFYAAVAQGVEEQASAEGRLCLICTTHGDLGRELAMVNLLRDQGTDAVIIVGGFLPSREYEVRMARYAESLASVGSILVLCGRPGLPPGVPHVVVTYENEDGAYAAASNVFSKGHRDVLFVGGHPGVTTTEDRIAGWRRAGSDHGVAVADNLITGDSSEAFGHVTVARHLADGKPLTAVVAYNDYVAVGAIRAVTEAGLQCPDDVSVIGYDDTILGSHLTPALTSVVIPAQELGRQAVRRALAARSSGVLPAPEVLSTHVVVRSSVTPARVRPVTA